MYFADLLTIVGREPVFDTGLLLAGDVDPNYLRRQLSEWVSAGKVWQLRRGLYALAPPYQKVKPHPFLVANRLVSGSYVSTEAALAYYGLIPEYVATVTSVTTRRPGQWSTPLGDYFYRHIQNDLFFGSEHQSVDREQHAFVATAEKALLDLIYLQPGGDERPYLDSLRLQNLDRLDSTLLKKSAEMTGKPKLIRAVGNILELVTREAGAYEVL